jgi:hypothetical protein
MPNHFLETAKQDKSEKVIEKDEQSSIVEPIFFLKTKRREMSTIMTFYFYICVRMQP